MSKKKTRERQLAKFRAKLESERRHRRRQRITAAVVALALGLAGTIAAVVVFTGAEEPEPTATPTPTPTPTASPTPSPTPEPLAVACGGTVPPATREEKPTFRKVPKFAVDPDATYVATIQTSCGTIELELFPKEAPHTVNSFVFLARKGFFDGLVFHRIANSIAVIQSGDPTCRGRKPKLESCPADQRPGPGYTIPDETFNGLAFEIGTLAMANSGPNTGGSQWFIITGKKGTSLPPQYTVFGKVAGGLDVAKAIQDVEVGGGTGEIPQQLVYVESVAITVM